MKCHDCPVPIPNGMQVIRSIRLQRVTLCTPCAEDRGWIDPNMRQASEVRGSMARMMSRMLVTVALVAAAFTFAGSAAAEATQPPPRCKVLSISQELQWVGQSGTKQMQYTVTTTTRRCRGKVVTTATYAYRLPLDGSSR